MNEITNHVPSLETCKKLNETRFPQETYFCWAREWNEPENHDDRYLLTDWLLIPMSKQRIMGTKVERLAAPILTEMLEQLPARDESHNLLHLYKADGGYGIGYSADQEYTNTAEAAALLWLELRKEAL